MSTEGATEGHPSGRYYAEHMRLTQDAAPQEQLQTYWMLPKRRSGSWLGWLVDCRREA